MSNTTFDLSNLDHAVQQIQEISVGLPVHPNDSVKPLVLIADDDAAVRQILRIHMEMNGFAVKEAGRGMQVLAGLHHNPDLVLLDISMPGLGGEDCLREIRRRRPGLKVIIVSGLIDIEDRKDSMNAFDVLAKPVDCRRLISSVNRAIALSA
ncbi:MAG: response regulator [Candidatus Methylacidiphilales bacterium]|nr:response regulator [Candidatus Methylacidiphilales bacterium]